MPTPVVSRLDMEQWFATNPLREWRTRWKISRRVAAQILDVSHGTVHNWECGLGQPQPEHFARLNFTAGPPVINWAVRWKAWLEKKPDFEPKPELPQEKTA